MGGIIKSCMNSKKDIKEIKARMIGSDNEELQR
jgi:hypothetical protein